MLDLDIKTIRNDWRNARDISMPQPFLLVGYRSAYVISNDGGRGPLLIDAEGVKLPNGAVYAWCRIGCCHQHPQRWPGVDAVADFHGSRIVESDGTVRDPVTPDQDE